MPGLLANRITLITNGAVGIGRAESLVSAREGTRIVADILTAEGGQSAQLVRQNGDVACFIKCDVTQAAKVATLVQEAVKGYGSPDCAFNNAGIEGATVCPRGVETRMTDRALNEMNIEGFAPDPRRARWARRFTNWLLRSRPAQKHMMKRSAQ